MPRWMAAVLFFVVAFSIWSGMHAYLYLRTQSAWSMGGMGRGVSRWVLVTLALSWFGGRLLEGRLDILATPLLWIGSVWMGLVALVVLGMMTWDLAVMLPLQPVRWAGWIGPGTIRQMGRWGVLAAWVLGTLLGIWGGVVVARGPRTVEADIPLKNLRRELHGLRLVHLSDLHLGGIIGERFLDRVAARVRDLEADLVVITGDLSDESDGGDGRLLARLAEIRGRLGIVASTGNHEAYAGGERMVEAIRNAGIRVLRQEHWVVEDGLVLAAIDDPTFLGERGALRPAMEKALQGRPPSLPIILMAHQPLAIQDAASLGVDLMLTGHTHGGQMPPFLWLNRLIYPFVEGMHRIGPMTLAVSRGTGWWGPPMRIGAPAEIRLYRLLSNQDQVGK